MERQTAKLDTGYSWVVAAAATVVVYFQLGLMNVFDVFVPEFEEHLEASATIIGLCTSIGSGLRGVLGRKTTNVVLV